MVKRRTAISLALLLAALGSALSMILSRGRLSFWSKNRVVLALLKNRTLKIGQAGEDEMSPVKYMCLNKFTKNDEKGTRCSSGLFATASMRLNY